MASLVSEEELTNFRASDAITALELASAAVVDFCGWPIAETADDTYTVHESRSWVLLPTMHLSAVTALNSRGDAVTIDRWESWGLVVGAFDAGSVVTFTHGYIEIPAAVRLATLLAAERASAATAGGVTQESLGSYSVSYGSSAAASMLSDSEIALLAPYRLPPAS